MPPRHTLTLRDGELVTLTTVASRGATYAVDGIDETEEELHIFVGQWSAGDKYPFPAPDEEVARLRNEIAAAGEDDPEDTARMEGETDDSYTTRLRGQLRWLRRPQRPT